MKRLLPGFPLTILLALFLTLGAGRAEALKSKESPLLLFDIRDGSKRAFHLWGNYVDYIKFGVKLVDSKGAVRADFDFKDRDERLYVPKDFDGTIQIQGTIAAVYGAGWRNSGCQFVRYRMRVRTDRMGRISIGQPVPPHGMRELRKDACPEILINLFDYLDDTKLNVDLLINENSSIVLAPSLAGSGSMAVSVGAGPIAVSNGVSLSGLTFLTLPHLELKVLGQE